MKKLIVGLAAITSTGAVAQSEAALWDRYSTMNCLGVYEYACEDSEALCEFRNVDFAINLNFETMETVRSFTVKEGKMHTVRQPILATEKWPKEGKSFMEHVYVGGGSVIEFDMTSLGDGTVDGWIGDGIMLAPKQIGLKCTV